MNRKLYFLILTLAAVFFLLLNLMTPLLHDDIAYHFYYDENSAVIRPSSTPITSFWQIFPSQWHHYLAVNGRFTTHVLVQLFCGLFNRGLVFSLCNTAVFAAFLHLFVKLSTRRLSVPALSVAVFCALWLMPYQGQTMLWVAGAVNYLWSATFALVLLYYMERHTCKSGTWWQTALAFSAGLFVGNMQEGLTLALSAALFFYFLIRRNEFRGLPRALTLGLWLGTLLLIFSPGTIHRLMEGGEVKTDMPLWTMLTARFFSVTINGVGFILPYLALVIAFLARRRRMASMLLPTLCWGFSLLLVYGLGIPDARLFFPAVTFGLWMLLRYCSERLTVPAGRPAAPYALSAVLLLASVPQAVSAYSHTKSYTDYLSDLADRVKRAPAEAIVPAEDPSPLKHPWVMVIKPKPDRDDYHNRCRAFFYGKSSVQYVAPKLYDDLMAGRILSKAERTPFTVKGDAARPVYRYADWWVIPVKDDLPRLSWVALYEVPMQKQALRPHQQFIRLMLGTLSTTTQEGCFTTSTKEGTLLFLPANPDALGVTVQDDKKRLPPVMRIDRMKE